MTNKLRKVKHDQPQNRRLDFSVQNLDGEKPQAATSQTNPLIDREYNEQS